MDAATFAAVICTLLVASESGARVMAAPEACKFPFIYKGVTYNKCITEGWKEEEEKKPWCSLTSNYDKDPRWKLCDEEVKENVALRGRAAQSSVFPGWGVPAGAINAVDGNLDNDFYHGSCIITAQQMSPWWRVDLNRQYKIEVVAITNSVQFPERMTGAEILIGDSLNNNGNDNPRCATVSKIPAGGTELFQCKGMPGRYVSIIIRGRIDILNPCEVQVFAYPEKLSCSCKDGENAG